MKRREFITLLAGAAAWLVPGARAARAQSPLPATAPAANQIGQVATLEGSATVTRAKTSAAIALQVNDPIFKEDTLATGANSALGVTFDDQTTFSLSANTRIVVNAFAYEKGGAGNAAVFNVALGSVAFVASLVAKTGDMKITTSGATLGIRGTTGVIDVPASGSAGAGEPKVKLYADTGGHVGRIEVFDPAGAALGTLTQRASAFTLRPGAGGKLEAVPYIISADERARDRGALQRLRATHAIGRRLTARRLRARGFNRPLNQRRPPSPGRTPRLPGPHRPPPRRPNP